MEELLEAALECPASERASFFDRACPGDEELRSELESLLISDAQDEAFIESPPERILYSQEDRADMDIMLMENFR